MQLNNLIGLFIQRLEAGQQPKGTSLLVKVINKVMNSSHTTETTPSSPVRNFFPPNGSHPSNALAGAIKSQTTQGAAASSPLSGLPRDNSTASHSSNFSTVTTSSFSYQRTSSSHGSSNEDGDIGPDESDDEVFRLDPPTVDVMDAASDDDDDDDDDDDTIFSLSPPKVQVMDNPDNGNFTSQA